MNANRETLVVSRVEYGQRRRQDKCVLGGLEKVLFKWEKKIKASQTTGSVDCNKKVV